MDDPTSAKVLSHRFCVAPMMDWTDRHCRYFLRLISKHALLYTEMVTTGALLHGDRARFLAYDSTEQPLALQLGGSNPAELARASRYGAQAGYREINLNVGCPSDRVQNNRIGACLMADPALVGDCIRAMQDAVTVPVTVKCRTGIDDMDSLERLSDFIATVHARSGCRTFIVHARIAILDGLSPKENREVPPLNYPRVYAIKQAFPDFEIVINGGIHSLEDCLLHLQHTDGVMLGRQAYQTPWLLHEVDERLFAAPTGPTDREAVMEAFYPYVEAQLAQGVSLHHMTRHVLGLYHGQKGGKRFRRHLSTEAHRSGAGLQVLRDAVAMTRHSPAIEEEARYA